MQELIGRIVTSAKLPPEKAEKALGIVLNLIQTQGNQNKVQELFDKLPGAAELARQQGGDGAGRGGGGLLGMLAGGMMGGPLAAISKLQALGLSTVQMKQVGTAGLAHARAKAGDDLVRQCASNIPGIGGFL